KNQKKILWNPPNSLNALRLILFDILHLNAPYLHTLCTFLLTYSISAITIGTHSSEYSIRMYYFD
ncbi:MAG: hypothetical protein FWF58_01045, partial [Firmicutes bacterium]|nr:hypothetical protein [Bacillota bacterium]